MRLMFLRKGSIPPLMHAFLTPQLCKRSLLASTFLHSHPPHNRDLKPSRAYQQRWSSTSSRKTMYGTVPAPSSYTPSNLRTEDYRDFSNLKGFKLSKRVLYYHQIDRQFLPYPPNSKGFLYLWRPVSTSHHVDEGTSVRSASKSPVHVAAGELRFRVVEAPDPNQFDEGRDLLTPNGTPWGIDLLNICRAPTLQTEYEKMLNDKERADIDAFLTRSQQHPAHCKTANLRHASKVLNSIHDPFLVEFEKRSLSLILLDPDYVTRLNFFHWLTVQPKPGSAAWDPARYAHPYTGKAIVRFDVVHSQRKDGAPILKPALRVLNWVKPPNPDDIAFQREGELLQKWDPELQQERMWVAKNPKIIPEASFKQLVAERSAVAETVGESGGKQDAPFASLERVTIQI